MSFRLKLFHRRREKASPANNNNDASTSGPTCAETSPAEPIPQLQSLFLTLLPLDIRLLVYDHILVVKPRLHIVDWHPHAKLSHIKCEEPGNDRVRHGKCWNHRNGEGELLKPAVITLGILQSCKLVYVHCLTGILPFYFPDLSHTHHQILRGSRFSLQAKRIRPRSPLDTHILCCSYPSHFSQFDSRFKPESVLVRVVPRVQRRKPETKHLSTSIQVRVEKGLRCTNRVGRAVETESKY